MSPNYGALMVQYEAINWIIIVFEIGMGMVLTGIFFAEIFPFLRLLRVKHQFNDEFSLKISKSGKTWILQILKTVVNGFLIVSTIIFSYIFTGLEVPVIPDLGSIADILPPTIYLVTITFLLLCIPKGIYNIIFPIYWIRQVKYFILLTFFFLPLFMLDQSQLENMPLLAFIYPDYAIWPNLLLPTQLLAENGVELTMIEKHQWFLIIFIYIPLGYSLLSQILPKITRRYRKFGIYEWKNDQWNTIDDQVYEGDDDTALLLLHGLGSDKDMWSSYTKEKGTKRIVDFIQNMLENRYIGSKIFAIDFSDRLKSPFTSNYVSKSTGKLENIDKEVELNNYIWELFYTIAALKHVKEIEKIHLICHSSGGLIARRFLQDIYSKENLSELQNVLDFKKPDGLYPLIDKVGWLAVPHFGAKGGESIQLSFRDTLIFKYIIRWLFKIPFVKEGANKLGSLFLALGLNAPAIHDLDPRNKFLQELNISNSLVPLYGRHEYKNAVAILDQVIGRGGIIDKNYRPIGLKARFEEEKFNTDHSNAPWEQLSQLPKNQIHDFPPIHHSEQVFLWLMSDIKE